VLLFAPLAALALGYALVWLFAGPRCANQALLVGAIFLTFVGPSVIFGSSQFDALSPWQVAASVAVFSCLTAFFYAYNLDLLERVPKVGVWLRRARSGARKSLTGHPWIRRWTIFGVGCFIVLPLPGSGTLGGSLVARLVGLTPFVSFVTVSVAGAIVAGLYGVFGAAVRDLPLWIQATGAVVVLVAFALLGRWLVRQGRPTTPRTGE
jgi:uncharacterized membrane protein